MLQFSQNNIDQINNRSKKSIQDQIEKNKNNFVNSKNKQNLFLRENNQKRNGCVSFKNIGTYKNQSQWNSQMNNNNHNDIDNRNNSNNNQYHQQQKSSLNSTQIIRSKKSILKRTLKNSLLIPKTLSFFNKLQDKLTAASLRDIGLQQQISKGFKFISQQLPSQNQPSINTIYSSSKSISSTQKQLNLSFDTKYSIIKKIGQGAHSTVYQCICKQTSKIFAFKRIRNISYQNWLKTRQYFYMMRSLSHENLIKYYEMFFDKEKRTMYVVMEYCEGGDLRMEIMKRLGKYQNQKFQEKQIICIMKKVLEVIQYLHSEGVCHRDLKPQNILYDKNSNKVKVIDLDVCGVKKYRNIFHNNKNTYLNINTSLYSYRQLSQKFQLWTNTGTLFYRALQTFGIGYTQKCDIWSIGIIIYQLLYGKTPFQTQYQKDFVENIKNTKIDQSIDKIPNISKRLKSVLKKCLQKDISKRGSASEVLQILNGVNKDDWILEYYYHNKVRIVQNIIKLQQQNINDNNIVGGDVDKVKYYEEDDKMLIGLGNMIKFRY